MTKKIKGRHYKIGVAMAKGILGSVELMYQHGTAYRFLSGLCDVLIKERDRRKSLSKTKKGIGSYVGLRNN